MEASELATEIQSERILLVGLELRYVLTRYALDAHSVTVNDLVRALEHDRFRVSGRPSKAVSDALRAEIARKRVVRTRRATYAIGVIPATTERRIRRRVAAIRAGRGRTGPRPIRVPVGTSWTDRTHETTSPITENWNVF